MANVHNLTPEQIEARRAYQRKRYAARKEQGNLKPDSYTKEQRKAYNKAYRASNNTDSERWKK